MAWIVRLFVSCFGPKPMLMCCIPRIKESTSTRFLYCSILIAICILSVVFHTGGLSHTTGIKMVGYFIVPWEKLYFYCSNSALISINPNRLMKLWSKCALSFELVSSVIDSVVTWLCIDFVYPSPFCISS